MESPRTGIVLLVLVAVSTAAGGFLGWTLRPPVVPVEAVKPAPATPVGATAEAPASLKAPGE